MESPLWTTVRLIPEPPLSVCYAVLVGRGQYSSNNDDQIGFMVSVVELGLMGGQIADTDSGRSRLANSNFLFSDLSDFLVCHREVDGGN